MDEITRYPDEPRPQWALIDGDLDRARIFRIYRESQLKWVRDVLEGPEYELVFEREGIRLYRRQETTAPS